METYRLSHPLKRTEDEASKREVCTKKAAKPLSACLHASVHVPDSKTSASIGKSEPPKLP